MGNNRPHQDRRLLLWSPYTGKPMAYDPKTNSLGFESKSESGSITQESKKRLAGARQSRVEGILIKQRHLYLHSHEFYACMFDRGGAACRDSANTGCQRTDGGRRR